MLSKLIVLLTLGSTAALAATFATKYPRLKTAENSIQFCRDFTSKPAIPGSDEWDRTRKDQYDSYYATVYQPYKDANGKPFLHKINWSDFSDATDRICTALGKPLHNVDQVGIDPITGSPKLISVPHWDTTCTQDSKTRIYTCCSPKMGFNCADGDPLEILPTYDSLIQATKDFRANAPL